jgi:hypothetical protein
MVDFLKLLDPKSIYVIRTNSGYVGGDKNKAEILVDSKCDARRLTVDELRRGFESIRQCMVNTFGCSKITFEVSDKSELPMPTDGDIQSILYNSIHEAITDWDISVRKYSDSNMSGNLGHAKVIQDHLVKRLPWLKTGSVIINLHNPNEFDKFSGGYFTCPKCKFSHLLEAFKHCPSCGIGLEFKYLD